MAQSRRRRRSAGTQTAASCQTDVRVLFVHPCFPNQFSTIAAELAKIAGYQCYGLVQDAFIPRNGTDQGVTYFGFQPDGQTTPQTYPYTNAFETGARNARGIMQALLVLQSGYRFDAVVGHAAFGASLFLKSILDCALVAYSELPGYYAAAARPTFPLTLDQALASRSFEALTQTSVLHADLCVVPSEHTKNLFLPELRGKIRVQMEGFDVDAVPPGGPTARQALGWQPRKPIVGFFSRTLEAVRGFDIFLRVIKQLHERDQSIEFVVIGEEQTLYGNEALYLNGQSFKAYALAQTGFPEGLIRWYRPMPYEQFRRHIACLDLVILPYFEGAGNWSVLEAMAVGLPILASNRCYIPEVIRNGLDGILLDPNAVDGFVDQALALLRDPRRARLLGRSAHARIRRHYSVARAAHGYQRIIEEAIAHHRADVSGKRARKSHGVVEKARRASNQQ